MTIMIASIMKEQRSSPETLISTYKITLRPSTGSCFRNLALYDVLVRQA